MSNEAELQLACLARKYLLLSITHVAAPLSYVIAIVSHHWSRLQLGYTLLRCEKRQCEENPSFSMRAYMLSLWRTESPEALSYGRQLGGSET